MPQYNDALGDRMKEYYENRSKTYLTRKTPVIIRLDGKAFHTYTKSLNKPFDENLISDMQQTTIFLCENIQGAKCGYVQSDEISILVTDYDKLTTDAWFDYNVQKMCSVSASYATGKFNQLRTRRNLLDCQQEAYLAFQTDFEIAELDLQNKGKLNHKLKTIQLLLESFNNTILANFDSRCFNIPREEVSNYFLWRQQDAERNSISMLAQSLYSTKELHKVNSNQMQELCFQKGHNWNDLHFSKKRGSFVVKNTYEIEADKTNDKAKSSIRTKWEVVETPLTFNNDNFKLWV
jgi:tRNA(His) 5'-end guanylyltransferase